jgi:hypothetical protein
MLKLRGRIFGVLVLAFPVVAIAGISKAQWIAQMQQQVPIAFCKPGMYFRECFRVTEAQCGDTASYATRQCLQNVESQLPPTLDADSGREWGTKVGTCAGTAYELAFASKKVSSAKCNDPTQWVPK